MASDGSVKKIKYQILTVAFFGFFFLLGVCHKIIEFFE